MDQNNICPKESQIEDMLRNCSYKADACIAVRFEDVGLSLDVTANVVARIKSVLDAMKQLGISESQMLVAGSDAGLTGAVNLHLFQGGESVAEFSCSSIKRPVFENVGQKFSSRYPIEDLLRARDDKIDVLFISKDCENFDANASEFYNFPASQAVPAKVRFVNANKNSVPDVAAERELSHMRERC